MTERERGRREGRERQSETVREQEESRGNESEMKGHCLLDI